jgi:hypothetical protein
MNVKINNQIIDKKNLLNDKILKVENNKINMIKLIENDENFFIASLIFSHLFEKAKLDIIKYNKILQKNNF